MYVCMYVCNSRHVGGLKYSAAGRPARLIALRPASGTVSGVFWPTSG